MSDPAPSENALLAVEVAVEMIKADEALARFKDDFVVILKDAFDAGLLSADEELRKRALANAGRQPSSNATAAYGTMREADRAIEQATVNDREIKGLRKVLASIIPQEGDDDDERRSKQNRMMDKIQAGVDKIADVGVSSLKGSVEFIEQIYEKMKQASPLLETIESLINLAMTLFFMPLGTKLADTLLPAVLDLLDAVVDMWDAFEGMSLGEMMEYAMEQGVQMAGEFLKDIGNTLKEQGGILGSIGNAIESIGDLVENSGLQLLDMIVSLVNIVIDHFKEIIASVAALYAMEYAMHVAQIIATTTSASLEGWVAGPVIGAGIVAGTVSYAVMDHYMAGGGYVPATPGGTVRVLGEGGEGEYVIPESKMGAMGVTNNFYITGLTYQDLPDVIDERVNLAISRANVHGAFRCAPSSRATTPGRR